MKPLLIAFIVSSSFAGCGSSSTPENAADSCSSVGVALCAKVYACYDADQITQMQYPATQDDCVTQQNADCGSATPAPGLCKGSSQTSGSAADACADELDAMSCSDFETPTSSGACKQDLCAD